MTRRMTISMTDEQAAAAQRAVTEGRAASVSGFIADAIDVVERQRGLEDLLAELDREFGPISAEAREWADRVVAE